DVLICRHSSVLELLRSHLSQAGKFYHCPMRGCRGGFAQLDCAQVTFHFESPDPLNSDHQHPVGVSCHRGSISLSGLTANLSITGCPSRFSPRAEYLMQKETPNNSESHYSICR
uniref:Uncharacterized protein n=1 Tax=Acanthochromis polyacanthus TaxID=80966 RepID=A0A3Q1G7X2_9TELE